MVLETIGLVAIGVMVVRAVWAAWKGRHDMRTGDPSRWERHDTRRRGR